MGIQDRLITTPERTSTTSPPVELVAISAPHPYTPSTTVLRIMSTPPGRYVYVTGSEHGPVFHTTTEGAVAGAYMEWSNELTDYVMPFFKAIHDWYEEQADDYQPS